MVPMEDELLELARRLRMARAYTGMTQAEAAEAALVSQTALSLYEKGRRHPHVMTVKRLALLYGVSVDWLVGFGELEDMHASTPPQARGTAPRDPQRERDGAKSRRGNGRRGRAT